MRKSFLVPSLSVLLLAVLHSPLGATTKTAETVPINVSEVVSGGTWTDGAASGWFRTVTVQVPGEPEVAQVYLQWIGSRSPVEPVELLTSVPVSEFNGLKLPSASVSIEAETEGEARIDIVGQESANHPPATVTLIATTPGHYTIIAPVAQNAPR